MFPTFLMALFNPQSLPTNWLHTSLGMVTTRLIQAAQQRMCPCTAQRQQSLCYPDAFWGCCHGRATMAIAAVIELDMAGGT